MHLERLNDDFQWVLSTQESEDDWDEFLSGNRNGSHYQSSMWGQCRAFFGWKPARLLVKKGDRIIGGAQWLYKKYSKIGAIALLLKGPVIDPEYPEILQPILYEIIQACHKQKIRFLTVRPPDNGFDMDRSFLATGFIKSPLKISLGASVINDLSLDMEMIFSKIKKNTRRLINRSRETGVIIGMGTESDLPVFYDLYTLSAIRQKFNPYPFEYFNKLWNVFNPGGHIFLNFAYYQGEPVSSTITIGFGHTVCGKYTAWSGKWPEKNINDVIWWDSIKWAKSNGYDTFDFDGLNPEMAKEILKGPPYSDDLYKSYNYRKLLYGGQVIILPDAYDYVLNPFLRFGYKAIHFLLKTQSKKIEKLWKKIKNG